MPRQRSARLPVLDSTVRRAEGSSSRTRALRARAVAVLLALVSLALLTVYLRESRGGGLHAAQRLGLSILGPFEVAGERLARPFADGVGYLGDLVAAKGELGRLRAQVDALRARAIQNEVAAREAGRLRALLDYRSGPSFPADYDGVAVQVIAQPRGLYRRTILVVAGSDDGVAPNDPVVTKTGLVGLVIDVTPDTAKVRLLTDQESAVSASVLGGGAFGIVGPGPGGTGLALEKVGKDELVVEGQAVITSGWEDVKAGIRSLYPRGILIGTVKAVGQTDVDLYKRIQVEPAVDFDSLTDVIVLVAPARGVKR